MQTGYRYRGEPLAGIFGLSSFLAYDAAIYDEMCATPPPLFLRHGTEDDFILPQWGERTGQLFRGKGVDVTFDLVLCVVKFDSVLMAAADAGRDVDLNAIAQEVTST